MSASTDDWIKMNERCPTNADMPIFRLQEMGGKVRLLYDASFNECADGWWRKADIPAPPKPEPTQREVDDERFCEIYGERRCDERWHALNAAWHGALAYRDAQIRADCGLDT